MNCKNVSSSLCKNKLEKIYINYIMNLDLSRHDVPQMDNFIYTCTSPTRTVVFSNMFSSLAWAKETSMETKSRVSVRRSSIDSGEDIFQKPMIEFEEGLMD